MAIDTVRQNAVSTSEFAAPLPAGTYLVGDPCYSFTNDESKTPGHDYWMEWLDKAWENTEPNGVRILEAEVAGFRIAASGTAYGDGFYDDQDGWGYGVDAGLIGAVPVEAIPVLYPELAELSRDELEAKTGTRIVDFDVPFHVSYDSEGGINVGQIYVMTGDTEEGDDDEQY